MSRHPDYTPGYMRAALDEARRSTPGHPDFDLGQNMRLGGHLVDWSAAERAVRPRWHDEERRRPDESIDQYATRVTELFDRRVAEEMAALAPVSPAWRKVALLWAADRGWPLFVSLGSAAAFACGAPTLGYGLLIGWAIGTVLS